MAKPRGFNLADFGDEPDDTGLYCLAEITWSEPKPWSDDDKAPLGASERDDAIYAIVRDHGNQSKAGKIVYIGMTTTLPTRFNQHHCADEIRKKRGATLLSVGTVHYRGKHSRWAYANPNQALRQIEHILIWAIWPTLVNNKNQNSIPLLAGKNIAQAKPWIIRREGHRFHGRMPREIVYPWMAIKPGRDRSTKKS